MSYKIQGNYQVPEKPDFRNPQPITKIKIKSFIMEFPDHIPFDEAKRVVEERAKELYEWECRVFEKSEEISYN